MLRKDVEPGNPGQTGSRAYVRGHQIAGKTGTAEKYSSEYGRMFDQAWWCGYGPADDAEIVVCALVENGGHGGMDFLMLWRIVYCLRNGLPMDQDVYDAATWSVIGPLSERSVANRGRSTDIPDFTRGEWKTMKPLGIVS